MAARRLAPPPPFTVTTPMQPTQVPRAFHVEGWVSEEKVDGYRMLAYKHDGTLKLISRQGIEHTHRFRELAAAVAALPHDRLILDGEVAVFDEHLVSRFEWLRGASDPPAEVPSAGTRFL